MKKKISIVLSVLMMASALGACGGKTTDAPAVSRNADAPGETAADSGKTPIKIAFSGPMTGDYAEYGQNFYAACEIAVDEINSSGGLLDGAPMELLQFDDKNSQEEVGAIAEMIASLSKPTVSLVLGGSHSICVPLAVSTDYSFIVKTGTMLIHPVRMSGMILGVPQTYDYFKKIQDRITGFISGHCDITQDRLEELMLETGMLTKDMGTILVGGEAVEEGLINEIGGIREALDKLYELIETDDNAGQTRRFGQRNQGQQENNGNQQE